MTSLTERGTLSLACANLEFGGLSDTGEDTRWRASMKCLAGWEPDIVLVQEHNGRGIHRLHAHLWRTANELGMVPVLGPTSPGSASGNHPAILVRASAGLRILDAGPPPVPDGALGPAWCEALVKVPGMAHPVRFVSVHLPARSATLAAVHAERLANLLAQRGGLVIVGGDWNGYGPADPAPLEVLHQLPAHLRPARMRTGHGGSLEPDYRVHYALDSIGLADAAAVLPSAARKPAALTATGITGGARVDRIYVSGALVPALDRYEQRATGGSDHQALFLTMNIAATAGVTPPPALP